MHILISNHLILRLRANMEINYIINSFLICVFFANMPTKKGTEGVPTIIDIRAQSQCKKIRGPRNCYYN